MKNNKFIKVIKTRKYKDINLYLRFSMENKPLLKEKVALLCKLIGDVTKTYPTKQEIAKTRDMLYGISTDVNYKLSTNLICLSVHYTFINPRFLNVTINDYKKYIDDTLYNSIIDDKTFDEALRTTKASTLRKLDTPKYLANEKVNNIITKDNPSFSIYCVNDEFIANLDKITLEDLKQTYNEILSSAQLHMYLCGDISEKDIKVLTNYNFNNRKEVKIKNRKLKCIPKKTIVDKKDLTQSCLSVVYSTPFNKKHKDYFAWFTANSVFGTLPTSLLFNEVREKMSLCYSIFALDYKNEGLVKVVTNIDAKNKDKAIKAINDQLQRLIKMDYDDEVLTISKTLLTNTIVGLYDDLDALVDYYYNSTIADFNYTIEEYIDGIKAVTKKDISRVMKKYKPYFNHILLGTENEKTL